MEEEEEEEEVVDGGFYTGDELRLIEALKGKILTRYSLNIQSRELTLSLFNVLNKSYIPSRLPVELTDL